MIDRSVQLSAWAWNLLSFALLIAPATMWLATWEAAPRGASPGKRLLRLRVQTSQGLAPRFARSLVRNGLKVALPWELGHTAAFSLAASSAAEATMYAAMACGIAACVAGCGYVASLFVGAGRTPYDLIAGTSVTARPATRRAPHGQSAGRGGSADQGVSRVGLGEVGGGGPAGGPA
jgi:uncharacterized RDD family membrane protein YckC